MKNYKASMLPKQGGEVVLTATSASEADALEGARKEASKYCEKTKKNFVVVSGPDSKYQGPERSGGAGIGATVTSAVFGRDKSQDYRAEIVFKCE